MRKCSSCGKTHDDLHLVTMPHDPHDPGPAAPGRVLLYCYRCRSLRGPFGVSIPVDLVTDSVFEWLYSSGRTTSCPSTAANIVFGEDRPELAAKVEILPGR